MGNGNLGFFELAVGLRDGCWGHPVDLENFIWALADKSFSSHLAPGLYLAMEVKSPERFQFFYNENKPFIYA